MTTGSAPTSVTPGSSTDLRDGVLAGLFAYFAWGILPAYFKAMEAVPPVEMVAHRVVWSVPFGLLIILMRRQWGDVVRAVRHPRTLWLLFATALLISVNWSLFVWAVQNDQMFQGSLGYYITPLFYVLAGVVFYNDPFRKLQKFAIASATVAVGLLVFVGGQFPVIALVLAVSFTAYGLIRKRVEIGGMPGLFIETIILLLPALAYLLWLHQSNSLVFSFSDGEAWKFMLSGPFTVLPLLMFALAARRLTLSTIGFMQFIGPTMQFILGVYFGEALTPAYVACFALIWLAAALYGYDAWANARQQRANIRSS
ncbi:MAG: EamA family transporter RarD [Gammaproteobacteria bacterium]